MENNPIAKTNFKKLIGTWITEGLIVETDNNPEMKIAGTDTYETVLDGYFILHKADVLMGTKKTQTYELIGLDDTNEKAILQHYNNEGSSGSMAGTLVANELKINGDGLRFKGQFTNNNKQIIGVWEKSTNQNNWVEFLKMNLTKVE